MQAAGAGEEGPALASPWALGAVGVLAAQWGAPCLPNSVFKSKCSECFLEVSGRAGVLVEFGSIPKGPHQLGPARLAGSIAPPLSDDGLTLLFVQRLHGALPSALTLPLTLSGDVYLHGVHLCRSLNFCSRNTGGRT